MRKIKAHLCIEDSRAALDLAERAQTSYPESYEIAKLHIESLALAKKDDAMLAAFEKMQKQFAKAKEDRTILETIGWGLLAKGQDAPSLSSRFISLVGGALTRDSKGVHYLLRGLSDTNAQMRAVSIELSGHYGDAPLKKRLCELFVTESNREVRCALIRTLGKLRCDVDFVKIVSSKKSSPKEKLAAIEAILERDQAIGFSTLLEFAYSKRAALRHLACEAIAHYELSQYAHLLLQLADDFHPEVSASALKALGLLRIAKCEKLALRKSISQDPTVGITASWLCLLHGNDMPMRRWLEHEKAEVQSFACAAINAAGPYGVELACEISSQKCDPNLGLALLHQRRDVEKGAALLRTYLQEERGKLMLEKKNGIFSVVGPSNLKHSPLMAAYPDVVDQTVRLELLNLLALVDDPGAIDAIKHFLQTRRWQVTGLAAELLLHVGDSSAIDLISTLLDDPDEKIRCVAALVLAVWGEDSRAIPTLTASYAGADRELKIKILEALSRLGNKESVPFFVSCLSEPSLSLRMVAASCLIQTLNK